MGNGKIIKSTREGKLYIETYDFFNQKKIKDTIKQLLESDIIKMINKRKK
jgi:hypothetical protein